MRSMSAAMRPWATWGCPTPMPAAP